MDGVGTKETVMPWRRKLAVIMHERPELQALDIDLKHRLVRATVADGNGDSDPSSYLPETLLSAFGPNGISGARIESGEWEGAISIEETVQGVYLTRLSHKLLSKLNAKISGLESETAW